MFYKLTTLAHNNSLVSRSASKIKKIFGVKPPMTNAELVKKYSPGKSFADVGALWGVNGLYSFIAEESGARKVVAVDIYPESPKFIEEKRRRNSKVGFVQGDIHQSSTTVAIGVCDVVLCSGVLYHTPDPIHLLTRLRAIAGQTLILNTASIPEVPGIQNMAVYYPFLSESQRKIWNRKMGSQMAITVPYDSAEGYGNWFWGMTPSLIESMLKCAGFEVKERFISPFTSIFVCNTAPIQLEASSGEWTLPKEKK
ncbi:MAG: methyltransferase domain-containing protein [Patescibacteria group bacterium]